MDAEMLKGHLDSIVLSVLERGPAHGYSIIQEIKQGSAGTFDLPEGTIYPALHRLEDAGLLYSAWAIPPGGRRRRVYSLSKAGVAALKERKNTWSRFARAVDTLLGGAEIWPA